MQIVFLCKNLTFKKDRNIITTKGEKMKKFIILGLISLFAGCAVVNVYVTFPEEKIKKAAEDILAPPDQSGQSGFFKFNFTKNLYAEEIVVKKEIKTDSPAIKEAKEKINSWRNELCEYKKEIPSCFKEIPGDEDEVIALTPAAEAPNTIFIALISLSA